MKDAWDIIILFLFAAIVGILIFFGVIFGLKKSVSKVSETKQPGTKEMYQSQSQKLQDIRRDQDTMMRDMRRDQERMRQRLKNQMRDLRR